jgi:ADP-dependent NAD(P)H-hydrate dehydratase / NAD(P)H-hydrate epimerase
MKLVTSAEMRALEAAAVEAGISEKQLMEEAGLAVAQEAWMLLGSLDGRRIVVLAGPGNNGGDGLVAARHLCDWGADVAVWVARARKDTSLEPELEQREIPIVQGEDDPSYERLDTLLAAAELVIDALLGIGQKRPLEPEEPITVALTKLGAARKGFSPPKVVAVDLPTGINADSGAVDPVAVEPDITVTFGLPKVGMYQAPASALLGRVQVVDIGIPKAAQDAVQLELLTARWAKNTLPQRPEDSNKGTFGKLLVVGGSRNYIGAPRMVATAAYRAGAGLVTVACPKGILPVLAGSLAEATWLPQEETDDGGLSGESAIALRNAWHGFSAAVVGPGTGDSDDTRAFTWAVLADIAADLPNGAVLDADALNAIATFRDARERVPSNVVLTPHPGELARLMKTTVPDIQSRRLEVAKEAASAFGCVVVLKGAHTVIAAPDGRARLSPFANPLLATAGSGDILAGIIGAYLAQGLAPFEAACLGVYVHAATGESLRADFGNSGLLALDIATRLPGVVRDIAAS